MTYQLSPDNLVKGIEQEGSAASKSQTYLVSSYLDIRTPVRINQSQQGNSWLAFSTVTSNTVVQFCKNTKPRSFLFFFWGG